jgi:PPOX class probable F420-dependent enzyme
MDRDEMRRRIEAARLAHLATVSKTGMPHVVAICFAVDRDTLYFAVDSKPKRTRDLQRLHNIAAHPEVSVLVDHYEEDWRRLWWVRLDGEAHVIDAGAEFEHALQLLVDRYPQYAKARPAGPVVAMLIRRTSGWSAS